MNGTDPELRVKPLFMDNRTFLRTNKWDILTEKELKLAINQLYSLLKPQALRENHESDLALDKHELRTLWKPFYRHVIAYAVSCDKYILVKTPLTKSRTPDREKTMKKNKMNPKHKPSGGLRRAIPGIPWNKEKAMKNQKRTNRMVWSCCL